MTELASRDAIYAIGKELLNRLGEDHVITPDYITRVRIKDKINPNDPDDKTSGQVIALINLQDGEIIIQPFDKKYEGIIISTLEDISLDYWTEKGDGRPHCFGTYTRTIVGPEVKRKLSDIKSLYERRES